jgi:hypothetical protein
VLLPSLKLLCLEKRICKKDVLEKIVGTAVCRKMCNAHYEFIIGVKDAIPLGWQNDGWSKEMIIASKKQKTKLLALARFACFATPSRGSLEPDLSLRPQKHCVRAPA